MQITDDDMKRCSILLRIEMWALKHGDSIFTHQSDEN